MRYLTSLATILLWFTMAAAGLAGSAIPDLKGTWTMKCTGIAHEKPSESPPYKRHTEKIGLADLEMRLVINQQDGFRLSGYIESDKKKETVSGVIGFDNQTVYLVSDYGIEMGRLVSPDKIESIFLAVPKRHSVAARGIFTRKRP